MYHYTNKAIPYIPSKVISGWYVIPLFIRLQFILYANIFDVALGPNIYNRYQKGNLSTSRVKQSSKNNALHYSKILTKVEWEPLPGATEGGQIFLKLDSISLIVWDNKFWRSDACKSSSKSTRTQFKECTSSGNSGHKESQNKRKGW